MSFQYSSIFLLFQINHTVHPVISRNTSFHWRWKFAWESYSGNNFFILNKIVDKKFFTFEIKIINATVITFVISTVMDIKDWTLHRAIEVKVPWLRAVPARQEWILPLKKWVHFFLGPWLLVCQFTDISNQMESTGEVSNVEQEIYVMVHYINKFFRCLIVLQLSPFDWKCL